MKLPSPKIEAAVADKKEVRVYLRTPHVDKERSRLVATSGYILAVLPVELDPDDTAGPLPLDAIKRARSAKVKDVTVNGAVIVGGVTFPREDVGRFPDVDKVIPAKPDREPDLVLDAGLLAKLAKALNSPGDRLSGVVRIWLAADRSSPLYVEPYNGPEGAYGAIMPMRS